MGSSGHRWGRGSASSPVPFLRLPPGPGSRRAGTGRAAAARFGPSGLPVPLPSAPRPREGPGKLRGRLGRAGSEGAAAPRVFAAAGGWQGGPGARSAPLLPGTYRALGRLQPSAGGCGHRLGARCLSSPVLPSPPPPCASNTFTAAAMLGSGASTALAAGAAGRLGGRQRGSARLGSEPCSHRRNRRARAGLSRSPVSQPYPRQHGNLSPLPAAPGPGVAGGSRCPPRPGPRWERASISPGANARREARKAAITSSAGGQSPPAQPLGRAHLGREKKKKREKK